MVWSRRSHVYVHHSGHAWSKDISAPGVGFRNFDNYGLRFLLSCNIGTSRRRINKTPRTRQVEIRIFDYNTISDVLLHLDYRASFDCALRDVVQEVTAGPVSSLQDHLATDAFSRVFSLNGEFPVERNRLPAGDTAELNITAEYLPFLARSATVAEASLVFTGGDDSPQLASVEFDGRARGACRHTRRPSWQIEHRDAAGGSRTVKHTASKRSLRTLRPISCCS
jgi:hypothetical protein